MQRRNFFKNLIASVAGLFAVSKTAKGHESDCGVHNNPWICSCGYSTPQTKTTLRFNENRIEAWNGEKWFPLLDVQLETEVNPCYWVLSPLGMTIPSPTAEQRSKLNNDVGEISPYPVVKERLLPQDKCMAEITEFSRKKGRIGFTLDGPPYNEL